MEDKNLHKKEGYSLPDGYFAESKDLLNRLGGLASSDTEGYAIPEGYFEQNRGRLLAQVEASDNNKKSAIIRSLLPVASVAAVAIAILMVLLNPGEAQDWEAGLSDESILAYLEADELSVDQLTDYADLETIETEETPDQADEYILEYIDEVELEDLEL